MYIYIRISAGCLWDEHINRRKFLTNHKEPPEEKGRVFDSVYAHEGISNEGSQTHKKYVTYDPDQGVKCRKGKKEKRNRNL